MKSLLNNVFIASGFEQLREQETVSFYQNRNGQFKEFFLLEELNKQEFLMWNETENQSLNLFTELKRTNANIEKNTSLILFVKADNFRADLPSLKNKILRVEEDAFYFKKYVILYTLNSIQALKIAEDVLRNLKDVLLNTASFTAFKDDMFADEQYLSTIQLFLKLPFLSTPVESEADLASIESLLNNRLSTQERNFLNKVIAAGDIEANLNWRAITSLALNQDANEEEINQFLANFEDNAQA